MPTLPLLIDTQSDLDRLCDLVAKSATVGVDTEFVRTRTYAPQLGLLQIAAAATAVCVDPLADLNYDRFWSLLFDPQRQIIMHSATQDLEVMWFHQGDIVKNLVDTQILAALLGYQPQIGYAGLVADLADVTLSKEQTRTDWTRRPLSDAQIDYAAKDVVYLDGMHTILRERLENLGRYSWALEDSAALCDVSFYKPDIENAWQRIKSIPFLAPEQQPRARRLAEWREQRAVNSDKPRKWILEDKALLALAAANPEDEQALGRVEEFPSGLVRRQSKALLAALAQGNDDYRRHPERYRQQIPNRERDSAVSKALLKLVKAKAQTLNIPAEILASRRDITALINNDDNARVTKGWRYEVIGHELLAAL